ncbi:MAG: nitroreductase family protein [Desulfamplus sp.]|nr:nitroreductase family protein [Desulfamplus sp.]
MFFDLIRNRRSIRKFTQMPVGKEIQEQLIEAALRAPSSRGFNPWRFIVVDDPGLLAKLSTSTAHGAYFLEDAPLGIVICGDSTKSDVWVEDASIATIYIQLAAQALGLGSCWIQIRKREHDSGKSAESFIQSLLEIPEHYKVESIVALGYADEQKNPHSLDSLDFDKVFYNTFGENPQEHIS